MEIQVFVTKLRKKHVWLCLGQIDQMYQENVCMQVNEESSEIEKSRKRESEEDIRNPN